MIMRERCGTWAGVSAHQAAKEPACGPCQMYLLTLESMPRRPTPPVTDFGPITPERAAKNRQVLERALASFEGEAA